jgi:hypothetical protein
MKILKTAFLGLLAAGMLVAADPSGKWEATAQTPRGEFKTTFNFKADGDKLTGTVGNEMMGESEIQDGKISGDEITFKQVMERGDRKMTVEWTGKVNGDEIELTRKMVGMGGGGPGGGPGGDGPRRGPGRGGPIVAKRVN